MSRPWLALALGLSLLLPLRGARADVQLPALVSDGMVLQANTPLRIWGWASEGEKVTVTLRGQSASTQARAGKWVVTLPAQPPGGPFEMTVAGRNTRTLRNVVLGEVWVCSGQSNMEMPISEASNAKAEIEAPADPLLRMFTVGRAIAAKPAEDVAAGRWESASPETRAHFSAVGYHFGRALREARRVPVGLIHSSWGGTP